jgi:hypothetical protein
MDSNGFIFYFFCIFFILITNEIKGDKEIIPDEFLNFYSNKSNHNLMCVLNNYTVNKICQQISNNSLDGK